MNFGQAIGSMARRSRKAALPSPIRVKTATYGPQCGTAIGGCATSKRGAAFGWTSSQTDACAHEPGSVLRRPPRSGRCSREGNDDEKGQLQTFEIEYATVVVQIEPSGFRSRIVACGIHITSVASATPACEVFSSPSLAPRAFGPWSGNCPAILGILALRDQGTGRRLFGRLPGDSEAARPPRRGRDRAQHRQRGAVASSACAERAAPAARILPI